MICFCRTKSPEPRFFASLSSGRCKSGAENLIDFLSARMMLCLCKYAVLCILSARIVVASLPDLGLDDSFDSWRLFVELVVATVEELSIRDVLDACRAEISFGSDWALVFRSNRLLLGASTTILNLDSEILFRCLRYPKLLRRRVASSADRAFVALRASSIDSGASVVYPRQQNRYQ